MGAHESESTATDCDDKSLIARMQRRLKEKREEIDVTMVRTNRVCINRVPLNLTKIEPKAIEPELVSIGPYHRGKNNLIPMENNKWHYLNALLNGSREEGPHLRDYIATMKALEAITRDCYNEPIPMSSDNFVEMMVLDSCFIVHFLQSGCNRPGVPIIPDQRLVSLSPRQRSTLVRDLLKLENQIPFFVIQRFCDLSNSGNGCDDIYRLASKFFYDEVLINLDKCRCSKPFEELSGDEEFHHLLDLFYQGALPKQRAKEMPKCCPSSERSIQCTTQLLSSGVKIWQRQAYSFLEIHFQNGFSGNGILEIPPININGTTITFLINCIALENCQNRISFFSTTSQQCDDSPMYFTNYGGFMSCLAKSPCDVALLSKKCIITSHPENSYFPNDQNVAEFFRKVGENVVFDIRNCYLSEQINAMEACYSSHYAFLMRKYFVNPWLPITVFYAFALLVLTLLQTIYAMLSYRNPN